VRSVALSSKPAGASGLVSVTFEQVPSDRLWMIDRLVVSCTSTTPTIAYVYDDPAAVTAALLGGTDTGNFDYDDANNPYLVDSGKQLYIAWQGASVGAVGVARAHYRLATRG
jgi:hypothetical protein